MNASRTWEATYNVLKPLNLLTMGIAWTLCLLYSHMYAILIRLGLVSAVQNIDFDGLDRKISNEIAIVTGASSGIGFAAAEILAKQGFHVVLGCRSKHKGLKALDRIKSQNPNASLELILLDLTEADSILGFVESFQDSLESSEPKRRFTLLVNNAGIFAATWRLTIHRMESTVATNYLGPFLLTQHLIPILQSSSADIHPRIINIVSFTHRRVGRVHLNQEESMAKDFFLFGNFIFLKKETFVPAYAYQLSKFLGILFSYSLHQQLFLDNKKNEEKKISVICLDPGLVDTNILREVFPFLSSSASFIYKCLGLMKSPKAIALSILKAALAPPIISGSYLFGLDQASIQSSSLTYDSSLIDLVWKETKLMVGRMMDEVKK